MLIGFICFNSFFVATVPSSKPDNNYKIYKYNLKETTVKAPLPIYRYCISTLYSKCQ